MLHNYNAQPQYTTLHERTAQPYNTLIFSLVKKLISSIIYAIKLAINKLIVNLIHQKKTLTFFVTKCIVKTASTKYL